MPPVVAAVVAAASAVVSTVAAVFSAVGGIFGAAGAFSAIGTVVGRALLQAGLSLAFKALFSPKRESVAARQASVLEVSLGETDREAIFGTDATGGSMGNIWNDGPNNEYETQFVPLADHECDGLAGYFVGDKYYTFTANGLQGHADFGSSLWIEFRRGALTDTIPGYITSEAVAAGEWTAEELEDGFGRGVCYVVVRYKVNETAWKGGRPQFRWVVRGLRCYDPRKDSTAPGGSGSHRWGEPSTYEFSDNAAICRANYMWGVWNYASDPPQLMVGPGKSFDEEPREYVIADANLCDELVSLKAGGTEKRYRVGAVVRAGETWIDVEENFAAAMGGQLVERSGAIGVDPGAAKTPVATFTDDDLIVGKEIRYQAKLSRDEMCNTVIARYADPAQLYEETSAPIRRSLEDITNDGQPYEDGLSLVFVRSGTQAQRIAEIHRRKKRLQAVAAVTLSPRFMLLEDADWVTWTSNRRFGGDSVNFEIHGVAVDQAGFTTLALKQINSSVFAWNPAEDELDPQNPIYLPPGALDDAELEGVDVEPTTRTDGANQIPAILVTWTPPTDDSIKSVLIQWRKQGSSLISSNTTADVAAGEYVIDAGLIGLATYEVRVTPLTTPQRGEISSAWLEVTVPEASGNQSLNFTPIASSNMYVFGRSLRKVAALKALEWDGGGDGAIEWDDSSDIEWDLLGWDGHIFSGESYVGGATALGIVVYTDKALMFGLSIDPAADDYFDNITFAWRVSEDGKLSAWEAGTLVWDNDGDPEDVEASDVLSVTYDGAHVRFYVSGVLKHERDAAANLRLYFDTSFYSDGARLDGASFASAASAGAVQETRYKRSVAPPATPTDTEPADWFVAVPSGSDALWSTTSTKTLTGALVSGWSTPALMSTPNWRGTYNDATTYYREDAVTYAGGSYRCIVESVVGRAPSGTGQDNPFWVLISSAGGSGPPDVDPDEFVATVEVPASTEGVNLYELAVAEGYTGHGDATITFEVLSGTTIVGRAGAPDGGYAITTGVWPDGYAFDLALNVRAGAIVRGGGGKGGKGGDCNPGPLSGENGNRGGDAIECLTPIDVLIETTAIVQGGGGGGGGADGRQSQAGVFTVRRVGGAGGGGGAPNGPGGLQGYGSTTSGTAGSAGTNAGGGNGGAAGSAGFAGRNGGGYGADGASQSNSGLPGSAGYCIRKNGFVVNVTNSGTTAGTIG